MSLGCPKNRVDSEVMLGMAVEMGCRPVNVAAEADVIVVNTCGFIGPAERESVEVVLEMARHRREGRCRCLVLAGCLAQRHPTELSAELPEVDALLGPGDVARLRDVLAGSATGNLVGPPEGWLQSADDPRVLSGAVPAWALLPGEDGSRVALASPSPASAYLKIAEGCDRRCAFCVIPSLRGRQRSRQPEDLRREAERLIGLGVKELVLVAQDTLAYGQDLPGRQARAAGHGAALARLVAQLAELRGVGWVRVLYLYPDELAPELMELLASHERVVPYVDMPMQHASDRMLRLMRRGHAARQLRHIVERLRKQVPGLVLRSTFIVGHPGESEADFAALRDFVAWAEPERLGVFRYSDELGTRSHELGPKVPARLAAARLRQLMALGRRLSRRNNRALVGRTLDVLVEGPSQEHPSVLAGRHAGQAPEIDGAVFLSAGDALAPLPPAGAMAPMRITQARDYDLVAEPAPVAAAPPRRGSAARS